MKGVWLMSFRRIVQCYTDSVIDVIQRDWRLWKDCDGVHEKVVVKATNEVWWMSSGECFEGYDEGMMGTKKIVPWMTSQKNIEGIDREYEGIERVWWSLKREMSMRWLASMKCIKSIKRAWWEPKFFAMSAIKGAVYKLEIRIFQYSALNKRSEGHEGREVPPPKRLTRVPVHFTFPKVIFQDVLSQMILTDVLMHFPFSQFPKGMFSKDRDK